MKEIMIDIETLDTVDTAVILSIGATLFDDGEIIDTFHRIIDIDSNLAQGRTVSGSTLRWWMSQPETARKLFAEETTSLARVLADFASWGEAYWRRSKVWCNGLTFDLPILESAFQTAGLAVPDWKYYNLRDFRTVKGLFSEEEYAALRVEPTVAHDALADAVAQTETLLNMRKAMK